MQFPGFLVQGSVLTLEEWDPDGSGPTPPMLVVGGSFVGAGGIAANNIIGYEPQSNVWVPFAGGVDGAVHALAVLPNNQLVVGGAFANAGATVVNGIATWNGTTWQPLAGGVSGGRVESLKLSASGDLFAGGTFSQANGTPASLVARWNGTGWFAVGAGLNPTPAGAIAAAGVRDLEWMPNGDLIAVGGFTSSGATTTNQVARWDGTSWSGLNLPLTAFGYARSITTSANGVIVAGTDLFDFVQSWDGTTWTTLPAPGSQPRVIQSLPNGDVILGTSTGSFGQAVRRLRGGSWTTIGSIPSTWNLPMCVGRVPGTPADQFVLGGAFTTINGVSAGSIARWNGSTWSGAPVPFQGPVRTVTAAADGTIFVGGEFMQVQGLPRLRVAAFDGQNWNRLGAGLPSTVESLAIGRNGRLHACLQDQTIRVFDGTTWSLSAGAPPCYRLVGGPDDRLAAVGNSVFVQTATGWQNTNTSGTAAVAFARDGSLLAAGSNVFPVFGRIARWTGGQWQSLDPTFQFGGGSPECIAELPDGSIVVGGYFFLPTPNVARRVGTTWQAMGNGLNNLVHTLRVLPNGELVAIGAFTASGNQPLPGIARWNGAAWVPDPLLNVSNGLFSAMAIHPAGDLLIASHYGWPNLGFARLQSNCPGTAITVGTGCPGSGGGNRLVASIWPAVGSTARTNASELPANALVFSALSVNAFSLPLASVTPLSPPGCTLWVAPDAIATYFVTGGRLETTLAVPLQTSLIGVTYRQQLVPCELDALGNVVAVTATPALALTVGGLF